MYAYISLALPSSRANTWFVFRVVKNRLQAGSEEAKRYRSALHGVLTIAREEGMEGLYRGLSSKLLQSVLTAAILFASQKRIYELTKQVRTVRIPDATAPDTQSAFARSLLRHLSLPSNIDS